MPDDAKMRAARLAALDIRQLDEVDDDELLAYLEDCEQSTSDADLGQSRMPSQSQSTSNISNGHTDSQLPEKSSDIPVAKNKR